MKKSDRKPTHPPLQGIHLTPAPFLPRPSATFPGWIKASPYEYLVHPAAVQSLITAIREAMAPREVIIFPPSESARRTLLSVKDQEAVPKAAQ